MNNRRLYRSRQQVIGGVCAGVAKYLNVDVSLVRIITFLAIFMGGVSFWLYVLAWVIIPLEPKWQTQDGFPQGNTSNDVVVLEDEPARPAAPQRPVAPERPVKPSRPEDNGPEW